MARLRPLPRRPAPPPLPTNDVGVAVAGTIGWALALIVLLIIDVPAGSRWWLGVCGTGIVIGLFAIWYVPRLQHGRAAAAERRAQTRAHAQAEAQAQALIHFESGDAAAAADENAGDA